MNTLMEMMNVWGARFVAFAGPMLLQSAVVMALLFALDWALRKRVRATVRYAVWMLALVKLVLPPSLALPTGAAYWLPARAAERIPTPVMEMARSQAAVARGIAVNTEFKAVEAPRPVVTVPPGRTKATWQAEVFAGWLTVALGMGVWVAWRWRLVAGVIRRSTEAPASVRAAMESCRGQWGIRRAVAVRCAEVGSPAICGILRPVILIPPRLAEKLDRAEMRSVLLHELAHYRRGDLWVNLAQIILQVVYWYNPLLWLANAGIRRAREQAVDEMVLVEMGAEAQAYPATLLHVAKLGLERPVAALGMMGILEPGRGLTRRILHIVNRPLPRTAEIGARGLAAVLALGLVALPMACRRKSDAFPPPGSVTHFTEKQLANLAVHLKTTLHTRPKESGTQGWPNEEVANRIFAFGSQGASAFPVLREAADDPDLVVRMQAIAGMGFIARKEPAAVPFLWEVLQAHKNDAANPISLGDLAFTALRNAFTAQDIPAVTEFLVDPPDMQNFGRYSPEAIADIINRDLPAAKPYLPALESLLDDTNAGVRFRAACALAPLEAATNPKLLKVFAATLAAPLPQRQRVLEIKHFQEISVEQLMALETLQKIGPAAKPLLGALRDFAASTEQDLYRKLALSLVSALEADPARENAQPGGTEVSPPANTTPTGGQPQIPDAAQKTMVLSISSQGTMTLQNEAVTLELLKKKLAEAAGEKPPPSLLIMADKTSPDAAVAQALKIAKDVHMVVGRAVANPTEADGPPADVIAFDDLSLPEAVLQLGMQMGVNIKFDPEILYRKTADGTPVPQPKVTEKWRHITPMLAMEALVDKYGWQMERNSTNADIFVRAKDTNAAGPARTEVRFSAHAHEAPPHPGMADDVADALAFDDLALPDAIRQLASLANLNIQFDPRVFDVVGPDGRPFPPPRVTEKWRHVTAAEAMQALLDNYGLEMTQVPGNPILRIEPRDPNAAGPSVTTVNLLENAQPAGTGTTTNTTAGNDVADTISFDNLELPNAVRQLAQLANLNIQFAPGLRDKKAADGTPVSPPKVTEKWGNISARQALQKLLDQYGWRMTLTEGDPILRVTAK